MKKILDWLKKRPKPRMTWKQKYVEDYLAKSTDMCDFEHREQELKRKGYLY